MSRAGVEDVAEFASLVDEKLRARPAGSEGAILDQNAAESISGTQRMPQANWPPLSSTSRMAKPAAAAGPQAAVATMNEHIDNSPFGNAINRSIDCPALADRPQIDFHSRLPKADPPGGHVELDQIHSGATASSHECPRVGLPALALEKTPRPNQWSSGNVKRPKGSVIEIAGQYEQAEQFVRDRLPVIGGPGIEQRQLAVRSIDRDPVFDCVNEIERFNSPGGCLVVVVNIEDYLELAGHRLPPDSNRVDRVHPSLLHEVIVATGQPHSGGLPTSVENC